MTTVLSANFTSSQAASKSEKTQLKKDRKLFSQLYISTQVWNVGWGGMVFQNYLAMIQEKNHHNCRKMERYVHATKKNFYHAHQMMLIC